MPIRDVEVRERLLDLFPAEVVREQVEGAMTKADAIAALAADTDLNYVRNFIADNFGRLHQHIHMFERDAAHSAVDVNAPFGVNPFTTREVGDEQNHFYLITLTYDLVLDDPLDRRDLVFAWPLKLVVAPEHVRLHFTIMAKNISSYVGGGRPVVRAVQSPKEHELLAGFPESVGLVGAGPLDLNGGIKALWDNDEFDAPAVQYKRARATSKDVMDEDYTVKRHDPALYEDLVDKPLFQTTLRFMGDAPCTEYFLVDPTNGTMTFRRYPDSNECIDGVIKRILAAN